MEDIQRQLTETTDILRNGAASGSLSEVKRSLELDPLAATKRDSIRCKLYQIEAQLVSLQNKVNIPKILTKEQLFERLCHNFATTQKLSNAIFDMDSSVGSSLKVTNVRPQEYLAPCGRFGESPRSRRQARWSRVIEQARFRNRLNAGHSSTNPKIIKITQSLNIRDWRTHEASYLSEESTMSSAVVSQPEINSSKCSTVVPSKQAKPSLMSSFAEKEETKNLSSGGRMNVNMQKPQAPITAASPSNTIVSAFNKNSPSSNRSQFDGKKEAALSSKVTPSGEASTTLSELNKNAANDSSTVSTSTTEDSKSGVALKKMPSFFSPPKSLPEKSAIADPKIDKGATPSSPPPKSNLDLKKLSSFKIDSAQTTSNEENSTQLEELSNVNLLSKKEPEKLKKIPTSSPSTIQVEASSTVNGDKTVSQQKSLFGKTLQSSKATPTAGTSLFAKKPSSSSPSFSKESSPSAKSTLSKSPSGILSSLTSNSLPKPETKPETVSGFDVESLTAYITSVYQKHAPDKIAGISETIDKYKGRELELIAKFEKKYKEKYSGKPTTKSDATVHGKVVSGTSTFGNNASTAKSTSPFAKSTGTGFSGASGLGGGFGNKTSVVSNFGVQKTQQQGASSSLFASQQNQARNSASPFSSGLGTQQQSPQVKESPFNKTSAPSTVSPFKTQPQSFSKPSISGSGGGGAPNASTKSMFGNSGTSPAFGKTSLGGGGMSQGKSLFGSGAGAKGGTGFGSGVNATGQKSFGGGGVASQGFSNPNQQQTNSGGSPFKTNKPQFGQTSGPGAIGSGGIASGFGGQKQQQGSVFGNASKSTFPSSGGGSGPSPFGKTQPPKFGGSGTTPFGAPRK